MKTKNKSGVENFNFGISSKMPILVDYLCKLI